MYQQQENNVNECFLLHKGDNIMEIKISCVHNYYGFKSTDTRSSFKLFNDGIRRINPFTSFNIFTLLDITGVKLIDRDKRGVALAGI